MEIWIKLTKKQIEEIVKQLEGKEKREGEIGKKIVELRDKKGLTWAEIEEKTGLSFSYCWQLYRREKRKGRLV
jgi:NAD+--asparagine ADP-ribosyltransferase